MSDALLALVLAAVFAGVFLTVLVFALPSKASAGSKRRLKQLRWFGGEQEQGTAAQAVAHAQSVLSWADRTIETRANTDRLAVRLEQAGIALRPQEWLLLWGGAAVAGAIVGVVLMPWYVGLPVGALVGVAGPWAYQVFAAKRRVGRFAEQLPDAMQMVVGSLQSGFSLGQALDTVVRETPAPLSTEFGRVLAEVQLGSELEDALERAADRTDSEDLACLVMAIRIQHEVGGSLAEVLTTSVATMRDRFRLHRHVRALSAEGRLSAYVLIGLPVGIGAYMFLFRNDYVRPLYTTFMGMTMLAGAAVMLVIGSFWMSRLIKVEV